MLEDLRGCYCESHSVVTTVCDSMDYIVHGILQARKLEWVTFPFSRGSSQPRDRTLVSALQADSSPAEPQGITNTSAILEDRSVIVCELSKVWLESCP